MRPVLTRIRRAEDIGGTAGGLEAWIGEQAVATAHALGAVSAGASVLGVGVGAGRAPALFALSSHVARALATDRYLGTALEDMLRDPGASCTSSWDPQRLGVEEMDPGRLRLPDESVDIAAGGLSLARNADRAGVLAAVDEIARILRPGGVASITLQVVLDGGGAGAGPALTVDELSALVIASHDWVASDQLDVALDDATRANPELVRTSGGLAVVDVHLALQRPPRDDTGPRDDVGALAKHLPDAVVVVDAGVRWGFGAAWEALGEHVRLIGFDPDGDECARLERRYAGRLDATLVARALGAGPGVATYRRYERAGVNTLLDPGVPTSPHGDVQPLTTDRVELAALDAWLAEHRVGRVDALKLDTQGYELEILRGAAQALEHVRVIDVEVAFNPLFADGPLLGDIDALLRGRGFLLWRLPTVVHHRPAAPPASRQRIDRHFYDDTVVAAPAPTGMLSWGDAHYVRADLAGDEDERDWPSALRDAVLANALAHHDLTAIALRRALEAGAPPDVAAAIVAVGG